MKFVYKEKLKILYTVPYESVFNPIELSFRHFKNITYKMIASKISIIKHKVESILHSKEYEDIIYKNFLETLNKYINYCKINENIDLNKK